jgi:N-acetylglutamate synthase-like GNAT family acetyltransferase
VSLVDFSLRPAVSEDFAAIRALIHAVHINPTGLDWRHFYIAESKQGKLMGCGQIKHHRDGSSELASIAVWKEYRGAGLARAIINKLLASTETRPLFLMCRTRLGPLYEKFGFRPVEYEEMPVYFKRIKRLERVFNKAAASDDRLLVMRLDGSGGHL